MMDKSVTRDSQRKLKNLNIVRINYYKLFDSDPQSRLLKSLKLYTTHPPIIKFIETLMSRKARLVANI